MTEESLLAVHELRIEIAGEGRKSVPVDGVSFSLRPRSTVGLVGESGCGKSLTALAILRLLPTPPVRIAGGRIDFDGRDLVALGARELRDIRGRDIAMIFQEPMTSLNPVYSCGEQIAEALRLHRGLSRNEAREMSVELLERVSIAEPRRRAAEYPHQLSGGMRQRIMIAMAISCSPRLLIADEPTTALDVTVQAQILELLDELQQSLDMSVLHISHDLAVLARSAHEILVMYAGRIVEAAPAGTLFQSRAHPYTMGLHACRPSLHGGRDRLPVIGGAVPDPANRPPGCAFAPRCPFAVERCTREDPTLEYIAPGHQVACFEAERVQATKEWPAHV